MNIDIEVENAAIAWGGGIDDTLGLALLIKQYGASALNVISLGKNHDKARKVHILPSFTEELIQLLNIDTTKFTYINEEVRTHAFRHIAPYEAGKPGATYVMSEGSTIMYYLLENDLYHYVQFTTEGSDIRMRENYSARHLQYYIPDDHKYAFWKQKAISNHMSFIKMPFQQADVTRHDVIEMYYQNGIQNLIPFTRSCGVKINQTAFNTTVLMTSELLYKNVHCGACPRCLKRKYGFKSFGVQDPTTYIV